ncbi:MAG: ATP-binding protein [Candidatus Omnitrophica bacterium]|nr:ATP-binding protein [Candidatus Omnitrophota bacterium]
MFSDPVVGEKFFGRTESLGLLSKRVNALKDGYRQNIAIVGPKLIGKSSLILQLFSNFSHSKIIPIYIDLRARSFSHFVYKFIGTLLYHYLKNRNLEINEELESLKKVAEKSIPKTVEVVQKIEAYIKDSQIDQAYEGLLTLTPVFKQESGISCIVILDEFHLLDTYKLKNPFSRFAKEIMVQKDTMYILTSSQPSYAKRILANELSLLFGNFEIIQLQPFDCLTCCKFLEKRFQNIDLSKTLRDFLISLSAGHPFYLDILSNKIKEKARELNRTEITRSLIGQALNSLIYDSKGILNQYFTSLLSHNLNGADYSHFLPILLSASAKGCSLSDVSQITKRQSKVVSRQINQLLDKDLLNKVGMFYRIQDKIFRFWLKSVYQRKSLSLSADPATESREFSQEIEEQILNFTQELKKGLTERVIELFKCFNNEIIMLQNKSFKFWHFNEVRPWPLEGLQDCIIARYKDGHWACLIEKEQISEAQIQEFFHYCRTAKYKIHKIIIIALKELDLNLRLAALEKKIWIWSSSDLNLLFDLYGKREIVH